MPRPCSQLRTEPVTTARTTSLTVPPSCVLDPLEGGQLRARPDVAAVRPDRLVQRHVGGRVGEGADDLAHALQRLDRLARRRLRVAHRLDRALGELDRRRDQVADARGRPARWCRVRAAAPSRRSTRRRLGHRLEVEEDGADVDAGDAVDHRVVGLGQDREAVALQALRQPQLPERLRAVQLLGEDAPGQPFQLRLAARLGQRGVADVVGQVEVDVVRPERPARPPAAAPPASGGSAAPGCRRLRTCSTRSTYFGGGPSKIRIAPTCMWLVELSLVRNEASTAVSRSRWRPSVLIPQG